MVKVVLQVQNYRKKPYCATLFAVGGCINKDGFVIFRAYGNHGAVEFFQLSGRLEFVVFKHYFVTLAALVAFI